MTDSTEDLLRRDRAVLWHPYTQHGIDEDPLVVASAKGSRLTLTDGREVLDGISSWWTCLHGHGHPRLLEAMQEQAGRLDHVLFAGATHRPAIELAERLVDLSPDGLQRVFYSDDGSTAVEVALKMTTQRWVQLGQPERRVFVSLKNAYHGDTFGAMSIGMRDPLFAAYEPMLFEVRQIPAESAALVAVLDELGERAAGVIVEPLVQGAAGMVMHDAAFLQALQRECRARKLPWIADEVMTGFGRTGSLFACDRAGVQPDLMCISKGLTGGCFPLAVTLASEDTFGAFLSDDPALTFFHGHTFTAHPIGCAAALASLDLCAEDGVSERLEHIGARIEAGIDALRTEPGIRELRRTGGIVAVELQTPEGDDGYLSDRLRHSRGMSLEQGVLLRPLGPVLYALPPACTSDVECDQIADTLRSVVQQIIHGPPGDSRGP